MSESRWKENCEIVERIVIEGVLELDSPAHFGNGDVDSLMDMPVLRDPIDKTFVLTGSSIAGALRAHLETNGVKGAQIAKTLFGDLSNTVANESALVIYDARTEAKSSELRDNVKIDVKTRSAADQAKFDIEVIEADTRFSLRFDLHRGANEQSFLDALGFALAGLEGPTEILPSGNTVKRSGEIGLGKRKTRGFGYCHAGEWQIRRYNMAKFDDLLAWIKDDRSGALKSESIQDALGNLGRSAKPSFLLQATLSVDGSILIRTDGTAEGNLNAPDAVHLKSRRRNGHVPIVSGTSLAGALRARAVRILNSLNAYNEAKTNSFVEEMFGTAKNTSDAREGGSGEDTSHISKLRIKECAIENSLEYVHTRVKIDRFTGGAFPSGLFSEQPSFGEPNGKTHVTVELELRDPTKAQIGLLLFLIKDLWTGDLPLGGQSSIGRGRLKGESALLRYGENFWSLDGGDNHFKPGKPDQTLGDLKAFVDAFSAEVK